MERVDKVVERTMPWLHVIVKGWSKWIEDEAAPTLSCQPVGGIDCYYDADNGIMVPHLHWIVETYSWSELDVLGCVRRCWNGAVRTAISPLDFDRDLVFVQRLPLDLIQDIELFPGTEGMHFPLPINLQRALVQEDLSAQLPERLRVLRRRWEKYKREYDLFVRDSWRVGETWGFALTVAPPRP